MKTYFWYLQTILILSGDIETNPGPTIDNSQYLTICHWNLDSITTDNFIKFPLLEAYISTHKFDIIRLSETFLDSSLSDDDPRLSLKGYSLIRSDHPNNIKQGGVCIYYKNHLPLIPKPDMTQLTECLVCELKINNKKCFITVLYRSPSQSIETFDVLKKGLEQTVFVGDFNARNRNWWGGDIDNIPGLDLDELYFHYGLMQLINSPTHILSNSAFCIDLIFTSQPNLIIESGGIHASSFERCHHQIIYTKINFKIHSPPPYELFGITLSQMKILLGEVYLKLIG